MGRHELDFCISIWIGSKSIILSEEKLQSDALRMLNI